MATFSMGSQTGVSLYAPSAAGGLVSLRGTDGLSSGSGVAPLTFLQDYAGPLARTVTDLAKILNVTTGTDPEDVGTVQADADNKRPADWTTALDKDALKGAKIGILRDPVHDAELRHAGLDRPLQRDPRPAAGRRASRSSR